MQLSLRLSPTLAVTLRVLAIQLSEILPRDISAKSTTRIPSKFQSQQHQLQALRVLSTHTCNRDFFPATQTMSDREFSGNDDLSLPKATVQKIVSEILPANSGIGFTKDARDLLIECCVEFITLISSEANEISEKESKKTIACEHITKALEQLGFGDYVQEIVNVASEHKEQLKGREKKSNKLEQSGLSTDQLLAMQEAAFRDAAQRHG